MKRRYRLLTLALAASALCAFPAMASAAPGFVASKYPATVIGGNPGSQNFQLAYGQFQCDGPAMQGTLAAPSESLSTEVANSTCHTLSKLPMEMNGCKYVLNADSSTFDIGPSGCGPIKVNMYGCQATVPSQSGLAASFEETGQGTVRFKGSTSSLKYSQKGTACKTGTHTNGSYSVERVLQAPGATLQIEDIGIGVSLVGAESAEPSEQPRVEADSYPVRLTGENSGWPSPAFRLLTGSSEFHCSELRFEAVLSQETSSFAPGLETSGCLSDFFNATVDMNTCGYTFDIDNAGPPYAATMGIDCVTPGDVIEIKGGPCILKVGEQAGLTGIDLTNTGEGADSGFEMEFAVEGVDYTREKANFLCPQTSGSFTNGKVLGELDWRGLK